MDFTCWHLELLCRNQTFLLEGDLRFPLWFVQTTLFTYIQALVLLSGGESRVQSSKAKTIFLHSAWKIQEEHVNLPLPLTQFGLGWHKNLSLRHRVIIKVGFLFIKWMSWNATEQQYGAIWRRGCKSSHRFPSQMLSWNNKEDNLKVCSERRNRSFDSSFGQFFTFFLIKVNPALMLTRLMMPDWGLFHSPPFAFVFLIFMIKTQSSSASSYTHAPLAAATSPKRPGNTKCWHWDWFLNVKTPQREGEVPQKR